MVFMDMENATLITLPANFWQTDKMFHPNVTKRYFKKLNSFFFKLWQFPRTYIFILRMFYWRRRKKLWQPIWFFSHRMSKFFPSRSQGDKTQFSRKNFSLICLLGHVRSRLDNPAEKVWTKGLKSLSQFRKLMKKHIFSRKKVFFL